jgi:hypothetical protein
MPFSPVRWVVSSSAVSSSRSMALPASPSGEPAIFGPTIMLMAKDDVQKNPDFVEDRYTKIKAMVAQGKSLDEVKTSFGEPTAVPPPSPNGGPVFPIFTEVAYKELSKKELIFMDAQSAA